MEKSDFAYCGLNCRTCRERFSNIRQKIGELDKAFEEVNMQEVIKVIPFMKSKYRGYQKFLDFSRSECPGCREGGGNPFCAIRKCAQKKGYSSCTECPDDICSKFKTILKVHRDNEVQNNREIIRNL